METLKARRTVVRLKIEDKDVTRDLAPYLTGFTYDDNASGEADSISITLEDSLGLFIGDWFPRKNARIEAAIETDNALLKCGTFEIDELDASQGVFNIKAVSAPVTSPGRREKETRAWENVELRTLAKDAADKAGLSLRYAAAANPAYRRVDQTAESALEFFERVAAKAGLSIKITGGVLAVYDSGEGESALTLNRTDVTSWSFRAQSADVYKSCEVSYFDSRAKKTYHGEARAEGEGEPSGQILKVNERVENDAQARAVAEKRLKESNRREITGSLTLPGDTRIMNGVALTVKGFGTFDGEYHVGRASHTVGSGGYTVSADLESGPPEVRLGGKGEKKAAAKKEKKSKDDFTKYWQ